MNKELNVLMIEDDANDVYLTVNYLKQHWTDINYLKVDTVPEIMDALKSHWDIILCDYHLPQFSGLTALRMIRDSGIDTPFILVSGQVSEDIAAAMMQLGANDYIMKDNLKRLAPAISREIVTRKPLTSTVTPIPAKNTPHQKTKAYSDKLLHPVMQTPVSADSTLTERNKAVINMLFVTEFIRKHQAAIFEKQNLTAQRFSVLKILKRIAPNGTTINRVQTELIYKTIDLTRLIEKMKQEGLLNSEFNPNHKRAKEITITDKGLRALEEVEKYSAEIFLPESYMTEEDATSINKALNSTLTKIKQGR